jgi:peptide/nickel transport system ATP-binding protein
VSTGDGTAAQADARRHGPAPTSRPPAADVLLELRGLRTSFTTMDGVVRAVDGVDYAVPRGGSVGVVGESGSGKSVTALTVMRLLESNARTEGEVWFDGREVLGLPAKSVESLRGKDMAMIFQEPLTSLNPVFTVGDQISEQVRRHLQVSKNEGWDRAIEAVRLVGIPSPERRVKQYPHELSGGMRQRVMIAMALSCEPKLLIADEPTTALDVTIQAQILELLKEIQSRTGSALLLITHDLGVVAEMVDEVVVMYSGQVVERGPVTDVLVRPTAPYTVGLIESIPTVEKRGGRLHAIKGVVANPFNLPPACRFEPRCPYAWDLCAREAPALVEVGQRQSARCHLHTPAGGERRRALDQDRERLIATEDAARDEDEARQMTR